MKRHPAFATALAAVTLASSGLANPSWKDNEWAWRGVKLDRGCIMYAYTLGAGFKDKHRRTWEGSGCNGEHVLSGTGTLRVRTKDGTLIASSTGKVVDGVWDGVVEVTIEASQPPRSFKTEYAMGCPVEGPEQGCIAWIPGTRRPVSHQEPHLPPGQVKRFNNVGGPRTLQSEFTEEERSRQR